MSNVSVFVPSEHKTFLQKSFGLSMWDSIYTCVNLNILIGGSEGSTISFNFDVSLLCQRNYWKTSVSIHNEAF